MNQAYNLLPLSFQLFRLRDLLGFKALSLLASRGRMGNLLQ
jgi:hypothetical protein